MHVMACYVMVSEIERVMLCHVMSCNFIVWLCLWFWLWLWLWLCYVIVMLCYAVVC